MMMMMMNCDNLLNADRLQRCMLILILMLMLMLMLNEILCVRTFNGTLVTS